MASATVITREYGRNNYPIAIGPHQNLAYSHCGGGVYIGRCIFGSAGMSSVAIGNGVIFASNGVGIGGHAYFHCLGVAVGFRALGAEAAVGIGSHASSSRNSIVIGTYAYAQEGGVALGNGSGSYPSGISIGTHAVANSHSVAIGNFICTAMGSIFIGAGGVNGEPANEEPGSIKLSACNSCFFLSPCGLGIGIRIGQCNRLIPAAKFFSVFDHE